MNKHIDFTNMNVGKSTTKITEGKMRRTIQNCPMCGKNGAYVKYINGGEAFTHTTTISNIKSGSFVIRTLTVHEQCFNGAKQ